jgi:hypothetical protein
MSLVLKFNEFGSAFFPHRALYAHPQQRAHQVQQQQQRANFTSRRVILILAQFSPRNKQPNTRRDFLGWNAQGTSRK